MATTAIAPRPELGLGFVFTAALLCFLRACRLVIEVFESGTRVQFLPLFVDRFIERDAVASAEAVTYSPILEYGGWGIRFVWSGGGSNRAYNMHGNMGVRLLLANGDRILLGSQSPHELAEALTARHEKDPANQSF